MLFRSLSEFAGAAKELDAAVLVNPHDIDGMAQAIARAFVMPADERRARWGAMMDKLRANTVQMWFDGFVGALAATRPGEAKPVAIPTPQPAPVLTYQPTLPTALMS